MTGGRGIFIGVCEEDEGFIRKNKRDALSLFPQFALTIHENLK